MKITPKSLVCSTLVGSAAFVIGCSETEQAATTEASSTPATRELVNVAKTETVNLKVTGMT